MASRKIRTEGSGKVFSAFAHTQIVTCRKFLSSATTEKLLVRVVTSPESQKIGFGKIPRYARLYLHPHQQNLKLIMQGSLGRLEHQGGVTKERTTIREEEEEGTRFRF